MDNLILILKKCWNGEEKLWKVYWLWGVLLGLFLSMVLHLIGFGHVSGLLLFIMVPIVLIYGFWWCVSTWRCSTNTSSNIWTILAKVAVVLAVIHYVFTFLTLFGHR